jgi:cytidylate kinase
MRAILEDIEARDARDMNRPVAPLKPAEDAIEIDSSALSIEQVLAQILALTQGRFS